MRNLSQQFPQTSAHFGHDKIRNKKTSKEHLASIPEEASCIKPGKASCSTKVFSTIDLRSGYHHIALGKDSRAKTAFVTPFGKYKFLMVPFGLVQAPAYFQLLMNKVLEGLSYAMTYLDDIIIFSKNVLEH